MKDSEPGPRSSCWGPITASIPEWGGCSRWLAACKSIARALSRGRCRPSPWATRWPSAWWFSSLELAQVALPLLYIRIGVAVTLVGLGVYKLIRSRHFRWGGMQVGFRDLTIWSFLMASAHGAGLMVLPVVLAGPAGASSYGRIPRRQQRRLGHAHPHAGILHRDRGGGVARLSEIRLGDASPVVVQSGSDLGDRIGSNRPCSAIGLIERTALVVRPQHRHSDRPRWRFQ